MTVSSRQTLVLAALPLILAMCGGVTSVLAVDRAEAVAPRPTVARRPVTDASVAATSLAPVRDAFLRVPSVSADPASSGQAKPALSDL